MQQSAGLAIHFELDCSGHGHIYSWYPGWKNFIDGVTRLPLGEKLRAKSASDPTRSLVVRPEQKKRSLLKEILCRFSLPGTQALDLFGGTCSCGSACITLLEHRKFLGCELKGYVHRTAKKTLIESFAAALLGKD